MSTGTIVKLERKIKKHEETIFTLVKELEKYRAKEQKMREFFLNNDYDLHEECSRYHSDYADDY